MNRHSLILDLLHDEAGFLISAELVLISTTVVLGLVAGLVCIRNAVVAELTDVGQAFNSLNQSYCYTGMHACKSFLCGTKSRTAGSCFYDRVDGDEQALTDFDIPGCSATPLAPAAPVPSPVPQVIPQAVPCPSPEPAPPIPADDPSPPTTTICPATELPPSSTVACPSPTHFDSPLHTPATACPQPLVLPETTIPCPPTAVTPW